jgi:AraC-like DNA-binding protein
MDLSGGETFLLEPGEFFSAAPVGRHDGSFRIIEIAPSLFEEACRAEGMTGSPHFAQLVTRATPQLAGALDALQRSLLEDQGSLAHEAALAMLVHAAKGSVLERSPRSNERHSAFDACARLREALHDSEEARVSILHFARDAGVSRFQLSRAFKERYGSSPHAYGIHVRVERARSFLRRGSSVAEAAAEAGFVDQSHFTRYFRRTWTLTPGQYARGENARHP